MLGLLCSAPVGMHVCQRAAPKIQAWLVEGFETPFNRFQTLCIWHLAFSWGFELDQPILLRCLRTTDVPSDPSAG